MPRESQIADAELMRSMCWAAAIGACALLFWAAGILLLQVLGWLKAGTWQGIPLYALLVDGPSQTWLRTFDGALQPLNIVPALGFSEGEDSLVAQIAGDMLGLRRIVAVLVETPLVPLLVMGSFASTWAAVWASNEEAASRARSART